MRSFLVVAVVLSLLIPQAVSQVVKKSIDAESSLVKARQFNLHDVRLLAGHLKERLDQNRKYLLSLDANRLVHNFRVNAGLPSLAEPLGGWEAPNCELRGHFTGHYLSACALMYASTGDVHVRERGNEVVDALAQCQHALGSSGYLSAFPEELIDRVENGKRVWAPYYTLHKVMAGLLDMYVLCENKTALEVVKGMAMWTRRRAEKLDARQMQEMLKTEFGGMAEVLANLSVATADPAYLELARRFEKRSFLDPLAVRKDQLQGLHANTHIPQVIGAAREYELTGDASYREIASFFWDEIVDARSYVTGGTSNYEYWRDEPYKLDNELSQESHENCCTYNMLRLTEHLFSWSPNVRFFDYYERALFSGILPTYHPSVGGAIMYYVPMKGGLFKMFGIPDSSYFCCNGSGIESFAKLGSNVYYKDENTVFINLFISSEAMWTEKGVTFTQETKFPEQEGTNITLKMKKPTQFTMKVRIPSWAVRTASVKVNGEPVAMDIGSDGYLRLSKVWRQGENVRLSFPMRLSLSRFSSDPSIGAVLYGPIVLAGALGTQTMTKEMEDGLGSADVDRMVSQGAAMEYPSLIVPNADPNLWIKAVKGKPLTFRTVNVGKPGDVTLVPFYKLFGQRYAVYWNLYAPYEWKTMQDTRPSRSPGVVDKVIVGDHMSDHEHNFQAYRFQSGDRMGRKWVKSPISFRYDVNIDTLRGNTLLCSYWGGDKECVFEILVDGMPLAKESLMGGKDTQFIDVRYPIPDELIRGKKRVSVMFRAKGGKPTAELYRCEVVEAQH
jgi:uncharacterized protein